MPLAILLLDPNYGPFYAFLGAIPSLCLTVFLAVLTLLYYNTKHFSCFVISLIFYLLNLYLCLFLRELEFDQFTNWLLGISTLLLLLDIILLVRIIQQPVTLPDEDGTWQSVSQAAGPEGLRPASASSSPTSSEAFAIAMTAAMAVLFLYLLPQVLQRLWPINGIVLRSSVVVAAGVQGAVYLATYILFTRKLKRNTSKIHRALYVVMMCLHVFTTLTLVLYVPMALRAHPQETPSPEQGIKGSDPLWRSSPPTSVNRHLRSPITRT